MITDPIPEIVDIQDLGAIVVASFVSSDRRCTINFSTDSDQFRAIGNLDLFGDPPEIGEHWSLLGTWESNKDDGDYFVISSARLSLPGDATIQIWLEYNVPGMNTWYPKALSCEFGRDIYPFLQQEQYDYLARITGRSKKIPFQLCVDASFAWRAYANETAAIDNFSNPNLRSEARRIAPFYGLNAARAFTNNPHTLLAFGNFTKIDQILYDEKTRTGNDPARLKAAITALLSNLYINRIRTVERKALESMLETQLRIDNQCAKNTIDEAEDRGDIRIDGKWVRGKGVLLIERSVASSLYDRLWDSADLTEVNTSTAAAHHVTNHLVSGAGISAISIVMYGNAISDLLALNRPSLDHLALVTIHAARLQKQYPNAATRIFLPEEIIGGKHKDVAGALVLSEAHIYSIAEWAKLLNAIPLNLRLVLIGAAPKMVPNCPPWVDICESISSRAHYSPKAILTEEEGPFVKIWSAIETRQPLSTERFRAGYNEGVSSIDVPVSKCCDAAVGLSHHLRQKNLSVQIFCPDNDIREEINLRVQEAIQFVTPSNGRDFGDRKYYVGDPVWQSSLWAHNVPTHTMCYVEAVYPHAMTTTNSDGRLERKHALLRCGERSHEVSLTQIMSLELGYALPRNCSSVGSVDVAIIVSSTLENLDWGYVLEAVTISCSQVVFIGPGAGYLSPSPVFEQRHIRQPSLFEPRSRSLS
ncbi:UNVERIFIED_ORG: hypothetical protein DFO49_5015 [Herbaspirillum seropedicae]